MAEGERLSDTELRYIRRIAGDQRMHPRKRMAAIKRGTDHWTVLLREAVADGRDKGMSWAEIGEALGVSKQAAIQRFRVRVDVDE